MTRSLTRSTVLMASLAMFVALSPLSALAQRGGGAAGRSGGGGGTAGPRGGVSSGAPVRPGGPGGSAGVRTGPGGGPVAHGRVVVAGGYPYRYGYGYGYPYGWYYPWYGYGAWSWNIGWGIGWGYPYYYGYAGYPYFFGYPYGYAYGYPYGYPYGYASGASLKLEVTPKTAEVFVDGYRAGIVDDFDGTFQRLDLPPGEHALVLYQDGYRTVEQAVTLSGSSSQRIKYAMVRLGPGDSSGPRPTPPPQPAPEQQQQQPPQPPQPQQSAQFGMISIRTQPLDAEILVDGEAWHRPSGAERLVIQLAPGRHRVEMRKTGFASYSEEVLIQAGATMTLNVSLLRGGGQ